MTSLMTGIADPAAAKRYLRRRWNLGPLPPVMRRPGARFYVTARDGCRTAFLLGPYVSHMTALAAVPRAERLLQDRYPDAAAFAAVGTGSATVTLPTKFGR